MAETEGAPGPEVSTKVNAAEARGVAENLVAAKTADIVGKAKTKSAILALPQGERAMLSGHMIQTKGYAADRYARGVNMGGLRAETTDGIEMEVPQLTGHVVDADGNLTYTATMPDPDNPEAEKEVTFSGKSLAEAYRASRAPDIASAFANPDGSPSKAQELIAWSMSRGSDQDMPALTKDELSDLTVQQQKQPDNGDENPQPSQPPEKQETAEKTQEDTRRQIDRAIGTFMLSTLKENDPVHKQIIKHLQSAQAVPGPLGLLAREAAIQHAITKVGETPALRQAQGLLKANREATHDEIIAGLEGVGSEKDMQALREFLNQEGNSAAKIVEILNPESKNQLIKSLHENPDNNFAEKLLAGTDKEKLMAYLDEAMVLQPKEVQDKWKLLKNSGKVAGIFLLLLLAAVGFTIAGAASVGKSGSRAA